MGGGFVMPDIGPLADGEWSSFIKTHLAPRALLQDNLRTYVGSSIQDYQDPTNPAIAAAHNDLMLQALQNPTSLPPQVVAGMKEAQKEATLSMLEQLTGANAQSGASRGLAGSGYLRSQNYDAQDQAVGNITKAYRDIDALAAQTNFADRLASLGAADQYQNSLTNRSAANYGNLLAGREFNAGEQYRQYGSEVDKTKFGYQRTLDEANLQNQAIQNALQAWSTQTQENLGRYGVMLDALGLGQNRELGLLNWGLGVASLGAQQQNYMGNWVRP